MRPWGGRGERSVARMLSDAKIPADLRPWVPLLVGQGRVLWIAGVRRSDLAPVTATSDRVLSVVCLDGPRWGP